MYREPIRVHLGTTPNQREMFFFCLGQLTAELKGKGFIPIYRLVANGSNVEFHMCAHGRSWLQMVTGDPPPEFVESPVDFVACPKRYFSVVLQESEYFIPVFVGECKQCGRRYVLHDTPSLKGVFGDER